MGIDEFRVGVFLHSMSPLRIRRVGLDTAVPLMWFFIFLFRSLFPYFPGDYGVVGVWYRVMIVGDSQEEVLWFLW